MPSRLGSLRKRSTVTVLAKEFHDAIRQYAPDMEDVQAAAVGWAAAKLFETAAAKIGDRPSSAQVLDGLWSIKNDDLGGLTTPLTFVKDQASLRGTCFFPTMVAHGQYTAPDSGKSTCRP